MQQIDICELVCRLWYGWLSDSGVSAPPPVPPVSCEPTWSCRCRTGKKEGNAGCGQVGKVDCVSNVYQTADGNGDSDHQEYSDGAVEDVPQLLCPEACGPYAKYG